MRLWTDVFLCGDYLHTALPREILLLSVFCTKICQMEYTLKRDHYHFPSVLNIIPADISLYTKF